MCAAALLALCATGCAALHSPPRWLEKPSNLQTDAHGGWIYVKTAERRTLEGELIALGPDSLYLAGDSFHALARIEIESARLEAYDSGAWLMFGWTFVGTMTTGFHGFYLLATAPMWLVGGSIATIWRSYDPIIEYPDSEWNDLRPYARFPQGLPPGIDRGEIVMKPEKRRRW
jgi:hypothetical protein